MADSNGGDKLLTLLKSKGMGTVIVFIILCVVFSAVSKKFLTVSNILNIMLQVSVLSIISMGMTWIIIAGCIDLSVGATIGFCGVITAMLIKNAGFSIPLGILVSIVLGCCVGLINGIVVTKVHIPPLLATIGSSTAIRGLAFIISDGKTIFGLPAGFTFLGRGYLWIIPIPVLFAVVIILLFLFLQRNSAFVIHTYAVGNNADSAYLSGIKTQKHIISLYLVMGLLVGFAAFINASRLGVGLASTGENIDFDVVTAVVLGGTSIMGGSGKIQGTILGCIIIGVLTNGMMILNMHSFAQQLAKGLVLLIAIGAETIRIKKEL
jgi:ribose transport system permease protein